MTATEMLVKLTQPPPRKAEPGSRYFRSRLGRIILVSWRRNKRPGAGTMPQRMLMSPDPGGRAETDALAEEGRSSMHRARSSRRRGTPDVRVAAEMTPCA